MDLGDTGGVGELGGGKMVGMYCMREGSIFKKKVHTKTECLLFLIFKGRTLPPSWNSPPSR